jgi:hypothetical protein
MTPRTQIRPDPDPEPRTQTKPASQTLSVINIPFLQPLPLPLPPLSTTTTYHHHHHHHLRLLLLLLFPYSASPSNLPPTNITSNITSHRITSPRPPARLQRLAIFGRIVQYCIAFPIVLPARVKLMIQNTCNATRSFPISVQQIDLPGHHSSIHPFIKSFIRSLLIILEIFTSPS